MHVEKAKDLVQKQLNLIKEKLDNCEFFPNTKDQKNHVYKIICGAGNHSQGGK